MTKIAALGHGVWGLDGTQSNTMQSQSPWPFEENKKADKEKGQHDGGGGALKYKVLGEYTDASNERLRIRVVFEEAPLRNFTIIGRILENQNSIEGRLYDSKGPRDGWKVELFKTL
ncbi:hypothetical protein FGO68_gene12672 [Halteria grandinella]|uniref:Uncharacterized protein n=1 Tax=Halteria grandinella TaxID=5974 RepID=A0A8J8NXZ0_HALGN|nr:hypothetical protein FGO68_gene12672 [Halteria grandinella]